MISSKCLPLWFASACVFAISAAVGVRDRLFNVVAHSSKPLSSSSSLTEYHCFLFRAGHDRGVRPCEQQSEIEIESLAKVALVVWRWIKHLGTTGTSGLHLVFTQCLFSRQKSTNVFTICDRPPTFDSPSVDWSESRIDLNAQSRQGTSIETVLAEAQWQ